MRKFNTNAVCEIRHAINVENRSKSEVSRKFKVSPSTVSDIAAGRSYRDIPMAKSIPGYNNYIAYPSGKVWSFNANRFIKPVQKSSVTKTRYFNLNNRTNRRSIPVSSLLKSLF